MKSSIYLPLFCIAILTCSLTGSAYAAQQLVTIDFNQVSDSQDFDVYTEDGFTLTANVGRVRVNSAFPPGSMAAQPSFGFGQGMDSSFTFSNQQHLAFRASSMDLLEASDFPDAYGVTMIGTRADSTVVTQTFTLDGIAGAQTFTFPPEFTNLVSLRITEDASNQHYTDIVQIDNVCFLVPLADSAIRTRTGIYGQAFIISSDLASGVSSPEKIPVATFVSVYNTQSNLVTWCVSNPVGQFYAYLKPGDYVLVGTRVCTPEPSPVLKRCAPFLRRQIISSEPIKVSVYPNRFTPVELSYGTIVP